MSRWHQDGLHPIAGKITGDTEGEYEDDPCDKCKYDRRALGRDQPLKKSEHAVDRDGMEPGAAFVADRVVAVVQRVALQAKLVLVAHPTEGRRKRGLARPLFFPCAALLPFVQPPLQACGVDA